MLRVPLGRGVRVAWVSVGPFRLAFLCVGSPGVLLYCRVGVCASFVFGRVVLSEYILNTHSFLLLFIQYS